METNVAVHAQPVPWCNKDPRKQLNTALYKNTFPTTTKRPNRHLDRRLLHLLCFWSLVSHIMANSIQWTSSAWDTMAKILQPRGQWTDKKASWLCYGQCELSGIAIQYLHSHLHSQRYVISGERSVELGYHRCLPNIRDDVVAVFLESLRKERKKERK